jgi:hypothetical protein
MDMAANSSCGKEAVFGGEGAEGPEGGLAIAQSWRRFGAARRTSARHGKDFQIIPSLLQTFPRKIQGKSKDFQTFSLAVSFDINGLRAESPVLRFSVRYGVRRPDPARSAPF